MYFGHGHVRQHNISQTSASSCSTLAKGDAAVDAVRERDAASNEKAQRLDLDPPPNGLARNVIDGGMLLSLDARNECRAGTARLADKLLGSAAWT